MRAVEKIVLYHADGECTWEWEASNGLGMSTSGRRPSAREAYRSARRALRRIERISKDSK